ncbi:uncharacterized protein I303_103565 [Kwoniella dejecticola CBS 10117]|uniref:Zinc knuckle family protein n=1 Tax=Kwoniella dejecticola CBS 10117 TaxID=1296121 RepID=A0A1A6A745_9TREE|nr:zinc knuckle family protein [Kwoniella dejecticola CBS 10117]OBR85873.1 zinc knuckle family protein [Kwoniella dejecticola CBS 10117]
MARFTSIGMGKKKFVQSAAEEAHTSHQPTEGDAGPSSIPASSATAGGSASGAEKKKKKRRGRERIKDETGKRIAIGEKKGPDAKKSSWGKDEGISRRAKLSAKHAEERKQRRNEQRNTNVTCFACRSVGHASKDCPNVLLGAEGEGQGSGMKRKGGKAGSQVTGGGKCYRCNSNEHSLHGCPEPIDSSNPTPFATCYICLGSGHLASGCPSNGGKGIYVNGGECKVCKSVEHRAKDCPDDPRRQTISNIDDEQSQTSRKRGEVVLGTGNGAGADEDDFMVESRQTLSQQKQNDSQGGKRKKHLPARNSERPMKRLREVDPVTGDLGERLPGGYEGPPEGQRPGQIDTFNEVEKLPLTARKLTAQQQPKSKPKVISF